MSLKFGDAKLPSLKDKIKNLEIKKQREVKELTKSTAEEVVKVKKVKK